MTADVEAGFVGQPNDPGRRQVGVLLRGAGRPLVAGQIDPDAIPHRKIGDPLADGVNHSRTVLVRGHLRERRRGAVAAAEA
jgi:hypothetical protein